MYQLTTLFLRDAVEELPVFTVKLNGIGLSHRFVEKSIACVQDFVRSPRFTQRDFFSDNGVNLLVSAVNAAGSMRDQSTYEPWASVLLDSYEATLVDLRKAYDVVVVRRKEARDTSERWFGVRSVESSEVGEPSYRAECGSPMLLKLDRSNTCLGLFLQGSALWQHYSVASKSWERKTEEKCDTCSRCWAQATV